MNLRRRFPGKADLPLRQVSLLRLHSLLGTGLLLLLVFALPSGGLTAQAPDPPAAGASGEESARRSQVQERIRELESATDIEEAPKSQLLELYRQVLARLDLVRTRSQQADAFRKSVETAPAELARMREELSRLQARTPEDVAGTVQEIPDDQVQATLAQENADLASLKARLTDTEKRLQEEEDRPAAARSQLAEARTALEGIERDLQQPSPSPDAPELERAARWLLEAREQARRAEIEMLEQELISRPLRLDLLKAARDLISQQVVHAEARVAALDTRQRGILQAETDEAMQEAERLRRETIGKHELVRTQAEQIAEITREVDGLLTQTDTVKQQRDQAARRRDRLQSDLEDTRHSLEFESDEESLGAVLLEQRRTLPDIDELESELLKASRQKSQARLQVFRIDRRLKQLFNIPEAVDRLLEDSGDTLTEGVDREELRRELQKLLRAKREQLERLAAAARGYHAELAALEVVRKELLDSTEELDLLLDREVIWIHNAPGLGLETLSGLEADLAWWTDGRSWAEVPAVFADDLKRLPLLDAALLLVLALLLLFRGNLLRALDTASEKVRRIHDDHLALTFRALGASLLLALPWPLLSAIPGWRLLGTAATGSFALAVGHGLLIAAVPLFVVPFLRVLARPGGVGEVHFRWNPESLRITRRELFGFNVVAVPCAFIVATTYYHADPVYHYGSGRIAFCLWMLAASLVAHRLLRPRKGLVLNLRYGLAPSILMRTRALWRWLCVLLPVFLATLASLGYTYLALQLGVRTFYSALCIEGVVIVYAVLYRWVVLSQRRLAVKVALEKRRAQERSEEAEDIEESQDGVLEMLEGIDVSEVKEQTLDILRITIFIILFSGLWATWASVFPALYVLEEITLWHYTGAVAGESQVLPITLFDVLVAALCLTLTVGAARNMPGFLEISLLQRLPLDPGTRYATRTLVLYGIVALGAFLTLKTLGISWFNIQWLVAALTVGLGFGLQEIFANFVSGLILLLERPIRVGDTVTVGTVSGVVSRIRMRATTITDWSRKELIVPNKNFITGELVNWSLLDPVLRMDFVVGIAYGSDTVKAQQVMLEVCRSHPDVLKQPEPNVFFTGFGDNSLSFEVRAFVAEQTNAGRTRILHDLHMGIDEACRRNDITIAFPQRDLHLKTADAVVRIQQVKPDGDPSKEE